MAFVAARGSPSGPDTTGPKQTAYASTSGDVIKPSDHGRTLVMPTNLVSWIATTDANSADALPDGFECNIRASGVGARAFRANANNVYVLPPLSTSGNQISIPEGETVRLEVIYNGAIRNIHIAQRINAPSVGIARIVKFLYNSGNPETYTPSPGAKTALMYITAGGGQGGGATGTGANAMCAGSGGASGQTTIARIDIIPGVNGTVTVGRGSNSNGATGGGQGGSSTVFYNGTTKIAYGGAGGTVGYNTSASNFIVLGAPASSLPTGGPEHYTIGNGAGGWSTTGQTGLAVMNGAGGDSYYGPGARSTVGNGAAMALLGPDAPIVHYGAGGGGAATYSNSSPRSGGKGADGIVIIHEYF